jgi:hypothetical protein
MAAAVDLPPPDISGTTSKKPASPRSASMSAMESTPQDISVESQPVAGMMHVSGTTVQAATSPASPVHTAAAQGESAGAPSAVKKSLLADVSPHPSSSGAAQLQEGVAGLILSSEKDQLVAAPPEVRDIEPPAPTAAAQDFQSEALSEPGLAATAVVSKPAGSVEIDRGISPLTRISTTVTEESTPVLPAASASEARMGSQEGAFTQRHSPSPCHEVF